jgi:hypothetical protein
MYIVQGTAMSMLLIYVFLVEALLVVETVCDI